MISSDPTTLLLAKLFPTLSSRALDELRAEGRIVRHPPLVTLCHEGEIEQSFFVIVEGRVDVYKLLEGRRLMINQLASEDHFGDIALLLDVPRTATIVTAEATTVFVVDRAALAHFIRTYPEIVVALSQLVLRRFLAQEEKHLVEIARLTKRDAAGARVFLSYARPDEPFVTRLANNLLKQQIDVWLDVYRLEPGKSWARQIGEALDSSHVMLVVMSPTSMTSENVDDEWNYYLDQKKPIVAVLHQPCKVPYRLSKLHYVNFHEADYERALARLVATLNTLG
jgi:CRP-like cAMP-binding protein